MQTTRLWPQHKLQHSGWKQWSKIVGISPNKVMGRCTLHRYPFNAPKQCHTPPTTMRRWSSGQLTYKIGQIFLNQINVELLPRHSIRSYHHHRHCSRKGSWSLTNSLTHSLHCSLAHVACQLGCRSDGPCHAVSGEGFGASTVEIVAIF